MRNTNLKQINKNFAFLIKDMPYFEIENLKMLGIKQGYLRIILSRLSKKGEVIRLKKGMYVSKDFIKKMENENMFSLFLEFLANKIYVPSYLSLEYVLYEHNVLTEMPKNFTLITKNKTITFANKFSIFIYHKIKDDIFIGFHIIKKNDFLIYKASKAKALFDFLYLRKQEILSKEIAKALRLNLGNFTLKDKKELKKYVNIEGSKKMKQIFNWIIKE